MSQSHGWNANVFATTKIGMKASRARWARGGRIRRAPRASSPSGMKSPRFLSQNHHQGSGSATQPRSSRNAASAPAPPPSCMSSCGTATATQTTWNTIHPRHGMARRCHGRGASRNARNGVTIASASSVGRWASGRRPATTPASANVRTASPPGGPNQERDREHRDRQAVQVGALRHQEREVRVEEPDVQVGLRRGVPRRVRRASRRGRGSSRSGRPSRSSPGRPRRRRG